jgi:molybdopterin-guanine dinucleotide biosynthesis protein
MKCVAIGGVPATGKTTLMEKVMFNLNPKKIFKYGLLRGYVVKDIYILGVYNKGETFGGTDKLSMAVQKDYEKFIQKKVGHCIFEGDRLFTSKNLCNLLLNYDTKIILLENDEDTLKKRHLLRGDNQSIKFIKGRATKLQNIKENKLLTAHLDIYTLNTEQESEDLANKIVQYLNH